MFGQIANRLKGRTKVVDEYLSLEEALTLLNGFNENTKGRISFSKCGFTYISLTKVAPKDMVELVRDNFRVPNPTFFYNRIKHQVYQGKRDEKHYLDLSFGYVVGRVGARVIKEKPFITASIDFVVEKEE